MPPSQQHACKVHNRTVQCSAVPVQQYSARLKTTAKGKGIWPNSKSQRSKHHRHHHYDHRHHHDDHRHHLHDGENL